MLVVCIILAAIVYISIGGFICDVMDDEDYIVLYISLWPIIAINWFMVQLVSIPYDLGNKIYERRWRNE